MKRFTQWFGSRTESARRAPQHKRARLSFETLEPRAMLAGLGGVKVLPAGIALERGGVLFIRGDKRDDAAIVSIKDDKVDVKLELTEFKASLPGLPPIPITTLMEQQFSQADVSKIVFLGYAGNDSFHNNTAIPCEAYGGNGDDTLVGGSAGDLLEGGNGNDVLEGRGGNDVLNGGKGNDHYVFRSGDLGADEILEPANAGEDTLDFSEFSKESRLNSRIFDFIPAPLPITIDLQKLGGQVVNPNNLTLILPNTAAIENVIGSGAADIIYGNARANKLYGGAGNDYIDGRAGKDHIEGGHGNDVLFGGPKDDKLFGGPGDDLLRGGEGNDELHGGAGNDGLFGGQGVDKMFGGDGNDRFLQYQYLKNAKTPVNEDQILDLVPADDAIIIFADSKSQIAFDWHWGYGVWSDEEILLADLALAQMHARTGNTKLLERADGSTLTYYRVGALQVKAKKDADPAPLAWNGGGDLHFPDMAFGGGVDWFIQIVQHETAHNWGNESLANWTSFLAISDWQLWDDTTPFDTTKYQLTKAYDQFWIFDKFVPFANDYGTTHPYEDFATAFESYFAHIEGRTFIGNGVEAIPDKWDFIDAFINTLL